MTWALCFNCGELKFGAYCPCPQCQVASTGDMNLDLLFSDHYLTRATLGALGEIVQQIKVVCDDDDERFWAFMKYVADNYPELLTLRLPEEYADGVTALLSSLCLPTIELELLHPPQSRADRPKEPNLWRPQSPSSGSGRPPVRAPGRGQQGQQWLDGSVPLRWLDLNPDAKQAVRSETDLEDAHAKGDRVAEGWILLAEGDTHLELLGARRAVDCYEQCLAVARETGDRLLEEGSLSGLGNASFLLLGPLQAIDYHEQALEIARESGDRDSEGLHLGNLGAAYRHLGEASRAIDLHEQALEIARETRNRVLEAKQLSNLGTALRHSGAVDRAVKHHEEALAIARELGDQKQEGEILGCLGNDCLAQSRFEQANRCFEEALDIARETGDRESEARWLGGMGNALLFSVIDFRIRRVRLRHLPRLFRLSRTVRRAMPLFQQAADIAHQVGDRRGEGCWLGNLGTAYHRLGRMRQAIPYYEQALSIARDIGDRTNEAGWLRSLGNAYGALREPVRAGEYYRQALAVKDDAMDVSSRATLLYNMGLRAKQAGDAERARDLWVRAQVVADLSDLPLVERIRRALQELND